jgi:predicted nucleic-acid-binding Zn-ribbon protein
MDDAQGYARLATHLNSKKAGPLVCPICNATESFEAKGTMAEPHFGYATCTNCGYAIFFDAGALPPPQ